VSPGSPIVTRHEKCGRHLVLGSASARSASARTPFMGRLGGSIPVPPTRPHRAGIPEANTEGCARPTCVP
jgi:hypothetical protein